MAEHLIQDTTLTGIADKIRSLLGLTGKMSPAQMQTNLTTEQANITAALAALTEKGVEVPAGANSNALAGLIAAIEAGGNFTPFVDVKCGTYTPAADEVTFDCSDFMTRSAVFAIGINNLNGLTKESNALVVACRADIYESIYRMAYGSNSKNNNYPSFANGVFSFGTSAVLQAGVTYSYLIASNG